MATVQVVHQENYSNRQGSDDNLWAEVRLPSVHASAQVELKPIDDVDTIVLASGAGSAAVNGLLGSSATAGLVRIGSHSIDIARPTGSNCLVACTPSSIDDEFAWAVELIRAAKPKRVIVIDSRSKPASFIDLSGEFGAYALSTGPAVPGVKPLVAPLQVDGVAAAAVTEAVSTGTTAVAIRCYVNPHTAASLDVGQTCAHALLSALKCVGADSTGFSMEGFSARHRKAAAKIDAAPATILNKAMFA